MTKLIDAVIGFALGDAVGVPYEFRQRDTFTCTDMAGYGTHNQPPGTWSDDTSMMLATMDAIISCGGVVVPSVVMQNFADWYNNGKYAARRVVFDIGETTTHAIVRFCNDAPADQCGVYCDDNGRPALGNGALMRILPLAFLSGGLQHNADCIRQVAQLTHANSASTDCCLFYIAVAKQLLSSDLHSIDSCVAAAAEQYDSVRYGDAYAASLSKTVQSNLTASRDCIKSTGFVEDTLIAALWCVRNTTNYCDCVLTAVNLGGDTDTIAALAGGLAGILYGVHTMPVEWLSKLARFGYITYLCDQYQQCVRAI